MHSIAERRPQTTASEWRSGWTLALAACAGMTLAPLMIYTMGVFMIPLQKEFGWSRAAINAGITVNAIVSVVLAPFVGMLIDRLGPRRIAIVGLLLFCTAFASLSLTNGSLLRWYGTWAVIACGAVLLSPTIWTAAVASRFDKARGTAIAITLCGSPITTMLAPLAAEYLQTNYGWRVGYLGIAIAWGGVALPLLLLFFFGAIDLRRRDGVSETGPKAAPPLPGVDRREAFTSPTFLKLAVAALVITTVMTATIVHLLPLLTLRGLDRTSALGMLSLLGVAGLCGRLIAGAMLDRVNPRLFGAAAYSIPLIAFLGLLSPELTLLPATIFVVIIGLGAGAEIEVSAYLTAHYFGMRNYGTMFGTIAGLIILGSGLGPPIAGFVYDRLGSYDLGLMAAVPMCLFTGLLILSLPRQVPAYKA